MESLGMMGKFVKACVLVGSALASFRKCSGGCVHFCSQHWFGITGALLVHLSWASSPFFFIFQISAHAFLAWVSSDLGLPTYASGVAGITGVPHHAQLVCLDWGGGLINFLP
jgi:hypothetical protein